MSAAAKKAAALPGASVVGIRANWSCTVCDTTATSHQLVKAPHKGAIALDLPPGWSVMRQRTFCPAHSSDKRPA